MEEKNETDNKDYNEGKKFIWMLFIETMKNNVDKLQSETGLV